MSRPATPASPFARLIAGALRRPIVRTAWTGLRDVWWDLRRRRAPGVDLPAAPERLLFVCQGNICRSPFAAERATALLRAAGRHDITCASAGYDPSQDVASPQHAVTVAARYGVDLSRHAPHALGLDGTADVIFVMESRQIDIVARRGPALLPRLRLLPAFAQPPVRGYRGLNIPDPFGQPLTAFERCYEDIDRALHGLVARLGPSLPRQSRVS